MQLTYSLLIPSFCTLTSRKPAFHAPFRALTKKFPVIFPVIASEIMTSCTGVAIGQSNKFVLVPERRDLWNGIGRNGGTLLSSLYLLSRCALRRRRDRSLTAPTCRRV